MTATADTPATEVKVAIIGAGFSGLGAAIRLKQQGETDFTILERGSDVGGTWHFNTYPGCACDVPSHLYSFSFAPNPHWSQTYSPQSEIRDYLQRTADDFGVRPFVRTNCNVEGATWNDEAGRWELETSDGRVHARVVICAAGPLTEPKVPEIDGLDSFKGTTMHSARWDHDVDLAGKRVASVGTGASAIQYVPVIQPEAEQLFVFQRTPPWVFPHSNRAFTGLEHKLYGAFPQLQKIARGAVYAARETTVIGFLNPKLMKVAEAIAKRHMRSQIKDPELLERVTPDYTIGCKRILPSNKWYPALSKPNVELVTSGLAEVREHSIVDTDGVEREIDVLIFGTGFAVTEMPVTRLIRGRDGRLLSEHWAESARAHLGTAAPGFPNLFVLLGPNTGLGHNSMVYMIESQINYVLDALRTMEKRGIARLEVRREVVERFADELAEKHEGAVWNTGCASWYLDDTGRNTTLWPDWTWRFRQRTAKFDAESYDLSDTPARQSAAVATAA